MKIVLKNITKAFASFICFTSIVEKAVADGLTGNIDVKNSQGGA